MLGPRIYSGGEQWTVFPPQYENRPQHVGGGESGAWASGYLVTGGELIQAAVFFAERRQKKRRQRKEEKTV